MDAKLFTLVNPADETQIFAWGMEITNDGDTTAVIYRRDPDTGRYATGVHPSAEAALELWRRVVPLELLWEPTPQEIVEALDRITSAS